MEIRSHFAKSHNEYPRTKCGIRHSTGSCQRLPILPFVLAVPKSCRLWLFSPRMHTWLKGTVLQVSRCTSWLLMGKMTPWEAGPFLNMKRCQNFLASSWRGDLSTFLSAADWVRAWIPNATWSFSTSFVGWSSVSGFFQSLPSLDSIFSLCLWPSPARLAPMRCGTATNRSGLSSASSWLAMWRSLRPLSRSTKEKGLWLWQPPTHRPAFPRGKSTSNWSKRRYMLPGTRDWD